ncbi:MAG: glycoside hydrolase family 2 TIM barrel-domain containing protein [Rikenellaceae bacterium]
MNLKKNLLAVALLLSIGSASANTNLPEYKDKSVTGVNRLDGRSTFWYYTNREDALKSSYLYHPENISLNGDWAFNFVERPADRAVDFYEEGYDTSKWDKIAVPGSWCLQGYDKPLYMNHKYEFVGKKPAYPAFVPDDWNPVGAYRRDFEIPADWDGKRIVLHFGAVKSSFYVWVNGQKVGYSQDSKMQAEFDITPYVKAGAINSVAVEVYRFSIGSYLEGQDMWRLAGIKRNVWVYPTEKSYVSDFLTSTSLTNDYKDGVLDLTIDVDGARASKGSIEVELLSPAGDKVFSETIKSSKAGSYKLSKIVEGCESWSDEHPTLYTLVIGYNNGTTTSYLSSKVGFRSVELKNSQLLVNGMPIRVKGVNRHEHHPKYGHYIPDETTERDIQLMKEFNVNAIRTSHYPADPYMYELCDKYGLFVLDEANVETHGLGAALQAYYDPAKHIADDPTWEKIFHDRIMRMYQRDKNHPSVIAWSMGNECGDGSIFRNGYAKLKATDPSRLVIFEQAGTQSHTDVVGPMYMTMDKIRNYSLSNDTYRPLILCEYCHAMGNSLGNFQDYWDLIDNSDNLQGGFIWDWVDQGLEDIRDGVRYFDYGGAFGLQGEHNDGAFCLNGIVNPDRVPNPHAYEMRKVYDNVDVSRSRNCVNSFNVRNKFSFTNLSDLTTKWSLTKNGEQIESGELKLDIAAAKESTISVPFEAKISDCAEYLITFEFALAADKDGLKAGYVVAAEQLQLSKKSTLGYEAEEGAALTLTESAEAITIKGDNFTYIFNAESGRLSSLNVAGEEFLKADSEYDFYRVPVDNDGWDKQAQHWKDAHKRVSLVDLSVSGERLNKKSYKSVTIEAKSYVNANEKQRLNGDFTTTYTISGDGSIAVDNSFIPTSYHAEQENTMPRLGERFELRGDLKETSWYGRGPWENYSDRKTSSFVGNYTMPTDELSHHYIRPQENGYRTDTRTLTLSNGEGVELNIIGGTLFGFQASHYPKENYFTEAGKPIRNSVDLKREENIFLNVDLGQKGIGGDNTWGNPVHVDYRMLMRSYRYNYTIKPTVK